MKTKQINKLIKSQPLNKTPKLTLKPDNINNIIETNIGPIISETFKETWKNIINQRKLTAKSKSKSLIF